jgi:hypothetical protein
VAKYTLMVLGNEGFSAPTKRRIRHTDPMALGWMVAVTTGIDPEDEIVLHRQRSQSEIEAMQLADGIQVIPISAHALLDLS